MKSTIFSGVKTIDNEDNMRSFDWGGLSLWGKKNKTKAREDAGPGSFDQELISQVEEYAIFRISTDGHILSWNKGSERIKGYSAHELIGQPFRMLFPDEDAKAGRPEWELEFARIHGTFSGEGWRQKKDGTLFWASVVLTALRDSSGNFSGFCKITRDMSDGKKSEEIQRREKENAEKLNFNKSTFLSSMSHEIRTPLSAILGFSEMITKTPEISDEVRHFSLGIQRNVESLQRLIDQILDLSKVEAGKLQIEKREFDFIAFIRELAFSLEELARKKGIQFEICSDGAIPKTIICDSMRLKQILLNVAGNAIKFTQSGSVKVRIEFNPATSQDVDEQIIFLITDTGVGMSKEQQDTLFQSYRQAQNSTARHYGGSGLGLSLARELAKALKGDVVLVSSQPGKGSIFRASVAVGKVTGLLVLRDLNGRVPPLLRPDSIDEDKRQLRGIKILLADDSEDILLISKTVLEGAGADVVVAIDGDEAVTKGISQPFDIVIVDIQMPKRSGNEAMMALREAGFENPIIALTASAMKGERELGIEQGFDEYLTKPLNAAALIKTVVAFSYKTKKTLQRRTEKNGKYHDQVS